MEQALKHILSLRNKVLKVLDGKVSGFFLGGGTALSLFYLHHRESFDLDFFTKKFSKEKITIMITDIENSLNVKAEGEEILTPKGSAKIARYYLPINDKRSLDVGDNNRNSLKIEFIEDVYHDIKSHNTIIDGIPILSKENIYLRKIYAACGVLGKQDEVGRMRFVGGRQEAKDLFDLYFLSKEFMRLSQFVETYCQSEKEKIIVWYNSYNRQEMKLGLTELIIKKEVDFYNIERHFKQEIEEMIKREIE